MLSAVILTKNEEKNIKKCIKSLGFCDEILVIDDNSIDKTRRYAKKMGARVFVRSLNKNFAEQCNFGISKSKNDWVFFVDADERIGKKLASEIKRAIKEKGLDYNGFFLKRIDFIWGKWVKHGEVGSFRSIRLFKKEKGRWQRRVHQKLSIKGNVGELKNPILHYPHKSLRKFIESIDRWSSLHAIANKEEGKQSNILKIVFWPIAHFVKNFIFKFGFLDGLQGFVFAAVMSFHSYLSWSKLWLDQKK